MLKIAIYYYDLNNWHVVIVVVVVVVLFHQHQNNTSEALSRQFHICKAPRCSSSSPCPRHICIGNAKPLYRPSLSIIIVMSLSSERPNDSELVRFMAYHHHHRQQSTRFIIVAQPPPHLSTHNPPPINPLETIN